MIRSTTYTPIFTTQCEALPENHQSDPLPSGFDADFLSVFRKFADEMNHSVWKIRAVHELLFPQARQVDQESP